MAVDPTSSPTPTPVPTPVPTPANVLTNANNPPAPPATVSPAVVKPTGVASNSQLTDADHEQTTDVPEIVVTGRSKPTNKPEASPTPRPTPSPTPKPQNKPANKPSDDRRDDDERPNDKPVEKASPAPKTSTDGVTLKLPPINNDDDDYSDISAAWHKKKQAEVWTGITVRALDTIGDDMLEVVPKDVKYYCPTFARLNRDYRIAFYVQLISALASIESTFNEKETYTEKFNDSSKTPVVSRGLLQLSKEEANLYGCQIEKSTELQTAGRNLRCGVRIMNKWIVQDHVFAHSEKYKDDDGEIKTRWYGLARNWGPFRHPRNRPRIQAMTLSLPFCHLPKKHHAKTSGAH